MDSGESGVHTVVRRYFEYGPKYGIEFVDPKVESYDLTAAHAGIVGKGCDVAHLHGLYFTGDYPATRWQHNSNRDIVEAIRHAKIVTVPSPWVREIFQRDMRFSPEVLPHGVDWDDWQHDYQPLNYVLGYAKNRAGQDVCDPSYLSGLARKFPKMRFMSTFHPDGAPDNVEVTGVIPYNEMKAITQQAAVFVQAVKETFGLHALEACAAGVPILAYAHGGVTQFVQHGVNGYLAEPGNEDDLARGLAYCLNYRAKLGANSREIAKLWTWEKTVEKLAGIYERAMQEEKASVAVVIPCYNKQATLERAVNSVLSQTYQPERIIIVDDGSTDESGNIGKSLAERYGIVEYVYQNNMGVSRARNAGVEQSGSTKYVCCLDGDDAIAPQFLETCVNALEADQSLHLAYTALHWIKPDGSEGISKWPHEWEFDNQLKRKNQVPTCNVFRRETFERLGGYRARYAPIGCGSEDAALWTMFGLHGYKCEMVTDEPLFLYSWMSGGTSQDGYSEVDWLQLYPSVYDGLYPFASYVNPINGIAHPVFQYDEPVISVIIPVGPGHAHRLVDALDSVESQRGFRKWEVIVVNDTGEPLPDTILKAYPYMRLVNTDGKKGPGFGRNRGAEIARGKFIVFLDSDDMLLPDFMNETLNSWSVNQAIVYTDYIGYAIIDEEEANKQKKIGKLLYNGGREKASAIRYPSIEPLNDFDCQMAQAMPRYPFYHWCMVTCLIPKVWHFEIGGFDENMESWEDADYHWRLAWAGKCYARVPEPLLAYNFTSGTRRIAASQDTEKGLQTARKLIRYIEKKKEGITMAPCSGCASKRAPRVVNSTPSTIAATRHVEQVSDQDFDLFFYVSPNRGDHGVLGGHIFPTRIAGVNMRKADGGGWRIDYGHHSGGEPRPFLVHNADAKAQPAFFVRAQEYREAPKQEIRVPDEPQPVDISQQFAQESPDNVDPLANFANDFGAKFAEELPEPELIEDEFDPQTIPGVTAKIAEQLLAAGKNTLDDLKSMSVEEWTAIRGVADAKAAIIMDYLAKLDD